MVIELRAKGRIGEVLARAQGETVQSAMKAKETPIECEVFIDDELAGIYKGQTPEHLERAVKFYLEQAGLKHTVRVATTQKPLASSPLATSGDEPASADAPGSEATPAAAELPVARPTAIDLAPAAAAHAHEPLSSHAPSANGDSSGQDENPEPHNDRAEPSEVQSHA